MNPWGERETRKWPGACGDNEDGKSYRELIWVDSIKTKSVQDFSGYNSVTVKIFTHFSAHVWSANKYTSLITMGLHALPNVLGITKRLHSILWMTKTEAKGSWVICAGFHSKKAEKPGIQTQVCQTWKHLQDAVSIKYTRRNIDMHRHTHTPWKHMLSLQNHTAFERGEKRRRFEKWHFRWIVTLGQLPSEELRGKDITEGIACMKE